MVEDGSLSLDDDFDLPLCQDLDHEKESANGQSLWQRRFHAVKVVLGIVFLVVRRYWITSVLTTSLIVLFFFLYGILVSSIIFTCGFFAIFYNVSDQLVYWPNFPPDSRSLVRLPSTIGLPCENLLLYAKDNTKLHAVFVKQDPHTMAYAPTFIYFHGNAGNIGHRLANIYDLYRFVGVNLLLVEYRGYGLSEGIPSEAGFYLDAEAALCYVRTRPDIDLNKVVLFGRSLGGAVVIDCAARPEMRSRIGAVVVENSFTSIPEMAKTLFANIWALSSLPVWFHKNKFQSKLKMCRVTSPMLLLSGSSDTLVPPRMMTDLYLACGSSRKRLFRIKRGTHNETWTRPGYYQAVGQFLDEVFGMKPRAMSNPLPPGVVCVADSEVL